MEDSANDNRGNRANATNGLERNDGRKPGEFASNTRREDGWRPQASYFAQQMKAVGEQIGVTA